MKPEILIETRHLKKTFSTPSFFKKSTQEIKAVDDVSFSIQRGETFGLVGESGCGKTTLGRTMIRLYAPSEGEILYGGRNIAALSQKELSPYHKKMQIIFQDPYSSLSPYRTIGQSIEEPMRLDESLTGAQRLEQTEHILEKVGLRPADREKYPHEFSGGQRQRVGIARALTTRPEFILCDEPISALDVSIQAQVINLLQDLQQEFGLSYLFVAHDLSMVRHISDRIGVMYLGSLVEVSPSQSLYQNPLHPYTKALLASIPVPDPKKARSCLAPLIQGDLPNPMDLPAGCRFHPRCPYKMPICQEVRPMLSCQGGSCQVACHLYPGTKQPV